MKQSTIASLNLFLVIYSNESVWVLLKRIVYGAYQRVKPKHFHQFDYGVAFRLN